MATSCCVILPRCAQQGGAHFALLDVLVLAVGLPHSGIHKEASHKTLANRLGFRVVARCHRLAHIGAVTNELLSDVLQRDASVGLNVKGKQFVPKLS